MTQRTLNDMAWFQECLSEQVDFFLEDLLKPVDDNEAWNSRVHALLEGWRERQGPFTAEVSQHIDAICDAVRTHLK